MDQPPQPSTAETTKSPRQILEEAEITVGAGVADDTMDMLAQHLSLLKSVSVRVIQGGSETSYQGATLSLKSDENLTMVFQALGCYGTFLETYTIYRGNLLFPQSFWIFQYLKKHRKKLPQKVTIYCGDEFTRVGDSLYLNTQIPESESEVYRALDTLFKDVPEVEEQQPMLREITQALRTTRNATRTLQIGGVVLAAVAIYANWIARDAAQAAATQKAAYTEERKQTQKGLLELRALWQQAEPWFAETPLEQARLLQDRKTLTAEEQKLLLDAAAAIPIETQEGRAIAAIVDAHPAISDAAKKKTRENILDDMLSFLEIIQLQPALDEKAKGDPIFQGKNITLAFNTSTVTEGDVAVTVLVNGEKTNPVIWMKVAFAYPHRVQLIQGGIVMEEEPAMSQRIVDGIATGVSVQLASAEYRRLLQQAGRGH